MTTGERKAARGAAEHDSLGPPGGGNGGDDGKGAGSSWDALAAGPAPSPDSRDEPMPPRAALLENQNGKAMRALFAYLINEA